jgi:hypothetical protein
MADCEVLEESDIGMRRVVRFKPGMGEQATEILTYHGQTTVCVIPPCLRRQRFTGRSTDTPCLTKIDFLIIETGNFMTNTISTGASEDELYLTFTFDGEFLGLHEGSKEAEKKGDQLARQAAVVVLHTIDQIRTMVREGKLGLSH